MVVRLREAGDNLDHVIDIVFQDTLSDQFFGVELRVRGAPMFCTSAAA